MLGGLAVGAITATLPPASAAPMAQDIGVLLRPLRQQYDLPALAAAVLVSGRTQALGAVGVRKYGATVPVTVHDQFHLGSCTKALTATLCGMLVERGVLRWDTTLAQVFPHLPMRPEYQGVTLDHLLAHRSGFSSESWPLGKTFLDVHHLPGPPQAQRMAYIALILQEPPIASPGVKYVYSNRNYAVAGAMVEKLTGISWEDFLRRHLFRPLEMMTAGFGAMGTPGREDQPWQHTLVDGKHHPIEPGPLSDNPPAIAPAGTVHCSVGDWAKFVALHLAGEQGTGHLLRPQTIRRLHQPQFGGDYAGGWIRTDRPWGGGWVLTHSGSNNHNYAVVWMAPLKNFAVLVMTNQGGDTAAQATDATAAALIGHFL